MKKIFVIIFASFFALFCVYNLIIPSKSFLENENRYANKKPEFSWASLASGKYTKEFEAYVTDKTAFRDKFVSLKSNIEKIIGKKENNGVYFCDDDYLIETYTPTDYTKILQSNTESINTLAGVEGLNVSFSLIPTAYEVLNDKLPDFVYNDYQKKIIEYTAGNLKNVTFINPLDTLNKNRDEYIYYRTDHHQTMHGSFLVYTDIMKKMNKIPYSKDEFDIQIVADDFYGTTWSKATIDIKGDSIIKYEPKFDVEYVVSFDGGKEGNSLYSDKNIAIKDKYTYYLDGNHGITTIRTKNGSGGKLKLENGGKLAVIKDSYAHSIIPFLANHYSEITVFDLRYYNLSIPEYLKKNEIKDVLFIYNIDNFIEDNNLSKISAYLKNKK